MTTLNRWTARITVTGFLLVGALLALCQPCAAETGTPPAPVAVTPATAPAADKPLATPDEAVLKALRWLKASQLPNGSWGNKYPAAMTGLSLLALLRHGETPTSAEFGKTIDGATRYLASVQNNKGYFAGDVYSHGIATLAMGEALAAGADVRPAVERAVQVVIDGQQPGGGYNYAYAKDSRWDTSVSAWQIQAMQAARKAGLANAGLDQALKKSLDFIKNQAVAANGAGFAYSGKYGAALVPTPTPSMTAAGVYCLQLLGVGASDKAAAGLKTLGTVVPEWPADEKSKAKVYTWYYVTQAKRGVGGDLWNRWRAQVPAPLLSRQAADGFWDGGDFAQFDEGSHVYTTAFAALILDRAAM